MKKRNLFITGGMALILGVSAMAMARCPNPFAETGVAVEAVSVGDPVYLDPGIWAADNAWFAMYTFGNAERWDKMEKVNGTSYYSAIVPDNQNVIFARMNPASQNMTWENKWDQTRNLEFKSDRNLYTITGWGENDGRWETYTPKADPSATKNTFYVYDVANQLGDSLNVYGFEETDTIKEMDWPGSSEDVTPETMLGETEVDQVKLSESYPNFIINDGTKQTKDLVITGHVGDVLVTTGVDGEDGKVTTEWHDAIEFTDATRCGYFVEGLDGWGHDNAVAMTVLPVPHPSGNAAQLMGVEAEVGDELRVNSFYLDRLPFEQWAETGNKLTPEGGEAQEGDVDYGVKSGDNFKFTKAGKYDIYAKYENGFKFYVAEHIDSYQVAVSAVYFEGATKKSVEPLNNETAYSTDEFNPTKPARDGYVTLKVYTDEACTTEYVPYKFTDEHKETALYVKYMKTGFYLISGAGSYSIENAVMMNTQGIADTNKAEILITAAKDATYSCVEYKADGEMYGFDELGATYSYVAKEDTHFKFSVAGTYSIYFGKDNKVYFNDGGIAFATNFISEIGGVCSFDGKTTFASLKAKWLEQKTAYNGLTAAEKKLFTDIGYDGGKEGEGSSVLEQAILKYHYILEKYGTTGEFALDNFIFGEVVNGSIASSTTLSETNTSFMIIVVASVTLISVASVATIIVIKRKRAIR